MAKPLQPGQEDHPGPRSSLLSRTRVSSVPFLDGKPAQSAVLPARRWRHDEYCALDGGHDEGDE